ncbi:MAG: ABC transporter ATP-binding protein [Planctomycetota bacterium]
MSEHRVEARDLSVWRGALRVVSGVSFQLAPRECLGVLGPNGSGKSTLLAGLRGQARIAGEVLFGGVSVRRLFRRALARRVAVVAQHASLPSSATVLDVALLGRAPHRAPWRDYSSDDRRRACEALERFGLGARRAQRIRSLSGGERRKLLLARALVQDTPVLLLDEPTTALDPAAQEELIVLLSQIRASTDKAIIVVLHDLRVAVQLCDRVLGLRDGAAQFCGAPADVLTAESLERLFGISFARYELAARSPLWAPTGLAARSDDSTTSLMK